MTSVSQASGGSYHHSNVNGSTVAQLTFSGSRVTFQYVSGNNRGKAQVYIENVLVDTIDQYSSKTTYNLTKVYSGLSAGAHTIKVLVSGLKNANAKDDDVSVDAFTVAP